MLIAFPFNGNRGLDPKKIPESKEKLLKYFKKKNPGIKPKKGTGYGELKINWWVRNKEVFELHLPRDSSFEPYYISNRYIQLYDETFVTWGFDKITQIKDMRRLGYKIKVMPDAFMVHLNHKDIKGYNEWSTGLNRGPRYRTKVGTSLGRMAAIPGFITNTFYPEWLKDVRGMDLGSSSTPDEVHKEIFSARRSIAKYKNLLYAFTTVYTFTMIFLINTIRKPRG